MVRAIELFPYYEACSRVTGECLRSIAECRRQPCDRSVALCALGVVEAKEGLLAALAVLEDQPGTHPQPEFERDYPVTLREHAELHERITASLGRIEVGPEWDARVQGVLWKAIARELAHRGRLILSLRLIDLEPPLILRPEGGVTPAMHWTTLPMSLTDMFPLWPELRRHYLQEAEKTLSLDPQWRPVPGASSAGDLLLHIPIWESFLISHVVCGDEEPPAGIDPTWYRLSVESHWDVLAERFSSVDDLRRLCGAVWSRTDSAFSRLGVEDLGRTSWSPVGDLTAHHSLWHSVEHFIHHLAQIGMINYLNALSMGKEEG